MVMSLPRHGCTKTFTGTGVGAPEDALATACRVSGKKADLKQVCSITEREERTLRPTARAAQVCPDANGDQHHSS